MTPQEEEFYRQLLAAFRGEADEHVRVIGHELLRLEKLDPTAVAPGEYETLFRAAHTFKGAARAVNAREIESLCHEIESVIARWKKRSASPHPEAFDAIHQAMDLVSRLVAQAGQAAQGTEAAEVKTAVESLQRQQQSAAGGAAAAADIPPPAPAGVAPGPAQAPAAPLNAAPPATAPADATVRTPLRKLESLLAQGEELLATEQAMRQRRLEQQELLQQFVTWDRRWASVQRARRDLETLVQRSADAPLKQDIVELLDFVDWTGAHLRGVERAVAQAHARTRRDEQITARLADAVRAGARRLLMLPAARILDGLPLLVRQLARQCQKEAEIALSGTEVEVDSRVLEQVKDALIHLVRNAIDHGVELPEARLKAGKPAAARVSVSVVPVDGNKVEITVADDGGGMDPRRLRDVAVEKGLLEREQAGALDDAQALQLIFLSGFSSSPLLTDLSGRGLGLAIVAEKVQRVGGHVQVQSNAGQGTRFVLTLPMTLSSTSGVLVGVAGRRFIVPASSVERVARIPVAALRTSEGRRSLPVNGQSLAVCSLAEILALPRDQVAGAEGPLIVVIVTGPDGSAALVVDEVLHNEVVLVRRFAPPLLRVRHIAGATVLGSGELVPVLNASDVLTTVRHQCPNTSGEVADHAVATATKRKVVVADDSITSRTLLRGVLESAGYEVRTAVNGLEALELLRRESFDLLVSDVEMPRLNGFDLTARVRRERRLTELPVVLVTALASDEDRARGIDVGASAYIVKSNFDQGSLLEIVRQLIN